MKLPDVQRFSNSHLSVVLRNTWVFCLIVFDMLKQHEKMISMASCDRMGICLAL